MAEFARTTLIGPPGQAEPAPPAGLVTVPVPAPPVGTAAAAAPPPGPAAPIPPASWEASARTRRLLRRLAEAWGAEAVSPAPGFEGLADPACSPLLLDAYCLGEFGEAWWTWVPETLHAELAHRGLRFDRDDPATRLGLDKCLAAQMLHVSAAPWSDVTLFEVIVETCNDRVPNFQVISRPSLGEAAWAMTCMDAIAEGTFSEDIWGWCVARAQSQGALWLPAILTPVQTRLHQRFPTLPWKDWAQAWDALQADVDAFAWEAAPGAPVLAKRLAIEAYTAERRGAVRQQLAAVIQKEG